MGSVMSIFRNFVVFVLVMVGVSAAIRRPLPEYFDDLYRGFRHETPGLELVFVGSSRIRQINTPAFREETARLGYPTRCLNLGADGMITPEAEVLLDYLLRKRPEHLRWIVIELDPWRLRNLQRPPEDFRLPPEMPVAQLLEAMKVSERSIWWHTPRNTFRSLVLGWQGRDTLKSQLGHVREGLQRLSPIGIGHGWVRLLSLPEGAPPEMVEEREPPVPDYLVTSAEVYQAQLALIDEPSGGWDRELNARYLGSLARRLRVRGLEPIFVIPSKILPGSRTDAKELEALLPGEEIWSFADPDEYPEFYKFENRRDRAHLTAEANVMFARTLARRFAEYRARTGGRGGAYAGVAGTEAAGGREIACRISG